MTKQSILGYLCCCFVSPYSLSKLSTIPREMRVALVGMPMQVAEHESESVGQKYICSLFVHEIIPSNCWRHAAFDHKRSINHLKTQLYHSVPIVFEIVFADNIFCSKPNHMVGFITPYVPPSPLTSPFCTSIYICIILYMFFKSLCMLYSHSNYHVMLSAINVHIASKT